MTKHFYAVDFADEAQTIHAFTSKETRDGFVEDGSRRFSRNAAEADKACKKAYDCTALEAVARGYI